jgi:hypothetical protein
MSQTISFVYPFIIFSFEGNCEWKFHTIRPWEKTKAGRGERRLHHVKWLCPNLDEPESLRLRLLLFVLVNVQSWEKKPRSVRSFSKPSNLSRSHQDEEVRR